MNKRANLYLNIYAFVAFILSISCIGLSLALQDLTYGVPSLLKNTTFLLGSVAGLFFISIEAFLFLLMQGKVRFFYVAYLLIDLAISIKVNTIIPFSAFVIFITLSLLKDFLRIILVDEIYINKEFDRYCKRFGVKVKDFRKKRKTVKAKDELLTDEPILVPAISEEPKKKRIPKTKKQPVG